MADTRLSPAQSVDADRHDHHHHQSGDVGDGGDDTSPLLQSVAEGIPGDPTVTDDPITIIEAVIERLRATDLPNYLRLRHKAKEANKGCLVTELDVASIAEIAAHEGMEKVRVQKMLRLARLAPDVVEDIARGQHPVGLSLEFFMRNPLPDDWDAQREAIGGRIR